MDWTCLDMSFRMMRCYVNFTSGGDLLCCAGRNYNNAAAAFFREHWYNWLLESVADYQIVSSKVKFASQLRSEDANWLGFMICREKPLEMRLKIHTLPCFMQADLTSVPV